MPRICEFFGIAIYLYFNDAQRHSKPHFHAKYGEFEAVYSIPDGDLLAGSLPKRQERLVKDGRLSALLNWNKRGIAL